jgi:hypothetical protein
LLFLGSIPESFEKMTSNRIFLIENVDAINKIGPEENSIGNHHTCMNYNVINLMGRGGMGGGGEKGAVL